MQNIYYINKQNVLTENIKKAVAEMNYNVRILSKEVDLLEDKIDKAIEYIKKYESIKAYYEYVDEDGYDEYNYDEDFKEELLEILGDKENEK